MIEEQLRAIATELSDGQAPITADEIFRGFEGPVVREMASRRRMVLVAAAVLVALAVLAIAAVTNDRRQLRPADDELPTSVATTAPQISPTTTTPLPAPAGFPTTPTTNVPTGEARADVSWWLPTALPADLEFRSALDWIGQTRTVDYVSGDCSVSCSRGLNVTIADRDPRTVPVTTVSLELGGNTWHHPADGDGRVLSLDWNDSVVTISGQNLTSDEIADIAASMRQVPETELPRRPIICCPHTSAPGVVDPGPVVAHVDLETGSGLQRWELHAYTDGTQFSLSGYNQSGDSPGPFHSVSSTQVISLGFRPGFFAEPRMPEGTGLIVGVAHPDVATIDLLLIDGETITYVPQDESDLFYENFIFVAIPSPDDGELADIPSRIVKIVARDGDGNEIFRCVDKTQCFGISP
jgi:hypothetical protein